MDCLRDPQRSLPLAVLRWRKGQADKAVEGLASRTSISLTCWHGETSLSFTSSINVSDLLVAQPRTNSSESSEAKWECDASSDPAPLLLQCTCHGQGET